MGSSSLHLLPPFSSFLMLLALPLLVCFCASTSAIGKNEPDLQALLEFRDKITHDPFGALSSWNTTIHFCQWNGIMCGTRPQRVVMINLQSSKLSGTISPHIGNLSFLRELILQNNSLSGQIPPEIGHLRRLETLRLGNNSIGGKIPINISNCSNLVDLRLSINRLVGTIPWELGALTKLQLVSISFNDLTGSIPHSLANLSYLITLSLGQNDLNGAIPDALFRLPNLEEVSFASNNLSGAIPPSLFNLSSLTAVDLGNNNLHGNLSSDAFSSLTNLTYFSVTSNSLTGSIPASISNLSNMDMLQLQKNKFTGEVPSLEKLHKLRVLLIYSNLLGSGAANDLSFLTSLTNTTFLMLVDISANQFGGVLPEQIGNFSSTLQGLMLRLNQIHGSVTSGITNLVNLERLDLGENQFSGTIPLDIGKLQKLVFLYLHGNRLSGHIPPSLGNLTSLLDLRLGGNTLTGNIPSTLGSCRNLLSLNLSRNSLTGSIHPQVIGLESLSIGLDLSYNNLTGLLPKEIGNMKNLGELYLSGNMLSGEIPSTLSSCLKLEKLDLGGNFFEGSIPSSLSSMRALKALNLSHNNLSGEIPEFLSNLGVLQDLDLSFNDLEGMLPADGIFKNASAASIEGNRKLCGGISEFHLPICSSERPKKKGLVLITKLAIGIVSGLLGILLVLYILFSFWFRRKTKEPTLNHPANILLELSYKNLYEASDGFSSANMIGMGSFGSVYKGRLDGGVTLVAIKVLNLMHRGALKSFIAECETLKNIRHRNLVKVLTVCSSIDHHGNDFKALVYQFMVNGSLEEWLHQSVHTNESDEAPNKLTLLDRLNVAIDVACALDYLHNHCEPPIVHCDLKPSNILLDEEMTGHVGDFGLARFIVEATNDSIRNQSSVGVRGTVGYAPPEYGMGNEVSTWGDVYSYGILLLEMFTGKKPVDDMFSEGLNLHNFVKSVSPEQVAEILDPVLLCEIELRERATDVAHNQRRQRSNQITIECLVSTFKIGVSCSAELPGERMGMNDVAAQLISIRGKLIATGIRTDGRTSILINEQVSREQQRFGEYASPSPQ